MFIMLLCIGFVLPVRTGFSINYFKDRSGVLFEGRGVVGLTKSSWNIIVHIDLAEYLATKAQTAQQLEVLRTSYQQLQKEGIDETGIVDQIVYNWKKIESNHAIIVGNNPQAGRTKRAPLEFIGGLMHAIFGVMDADHAKILEEKVKLSRKEDDFVLKLLANMTSIQDATDTVLKNQTGQINNIFGKINTALYNVTSEIKTVHDHGWFQDLAMNLVLILESLKKLQDDMEAIIYTRQTAIPEKVLPTRILSLHLAEMLMHLPETLQVASRNPVELLKIASMTSRVTKESIICNVKVPLIQSIKFQAYRYYSYPIFHDGHYLKLHSKFDVLCINEDKSKYFMAEENMFLKCSRLQMMWICPQLTSVRKVSGQSQCELDIFLRKKKLSSTCQLQGEPWQSTWEQLNARNSWLFSVPMEQRIEIKCGNNVTEVMVMNQGILQAEPDCQIQSDDVLLWTEDDIVEDVWLISTKFNLTSQLPTMKNIAQFTPLTPITLNELPKMKTEIKYGDAFELLDVWQETLDAKGIITILLMVVAAILIIRVLVCWTIRLTTPSAPTFTLPR